MGTMAKANQPNRLLGSNGPPAASCWPPTDQANGRPFQVQPRPLRVRHTDTGPIAATTSPPAPISHQKLSGS